MSNLSLSRIARLYEAVDAFRAEVRSLGRDPDRLYFAEGLQAARTRAGLSQRQVAAHVGMDHSFVSMLESGARNPSIDAANKLAAALGVSVLALFLPYLFETGSREARR